ncbi:FtsH protease activity modulator HflK [Thorsellia kenyensis]|uniref:Protein HflK n=1 Tax=Thorsellia kenyensis TaxID=1549888 RepID=A0ABV6C9R8_9GAMM
MVWNEPGNNGKKDPLGFGGKNEDKKDKDPITNNEPKDDKSGNEGQNNNPWGQPETKNRPKNNKGGSSITDVFSKILKDAKGSKGNGGGNRPSSDMQIPSKLIPAILLGGLALWGVSGFYTVKEAEVAVITRFGAFHEIKQPGLNWRPVFIDDYRTIDIKKRYDINSSGRMLTSDEKLIDIVDMNVKYTIVDPKSFFFSVVNPNDSLTQALDSALRGVIGRNALEIILTQGRDSIRFDTKTELEKTIAPYNMGVQIEEVNFQEAKPPREVQDAFDDAIAARENEQQLINEAGEYRNRQLPLAKGEAERIIQNANAIRENTILQAEGEVARFVKLLPEYQANPVITSQRLYIETMERVLSQTRKIIMDSDGNKLTVLPIDQLLKSTSQGTSNNNSAVNNTINTNAPNNSASSSVSTTYSETQSTTPVTSNSPRTAPAVERIVPQGRINNASDRLSAISGGN